MEANNTPERFSVGDAVVKSTTRDTVGVVVQPRFRQNAKWWHRVRFGGRVEAVLEDDLEPFMESVDIRTLIARGVYASNAALSRRVTLAKLQSPLRDAIYSMNASRTQFHAYQFKPLLKFLGSDKLRLLIADEVGLGKTIEAGFVLREQKARSDVDRVLVVCPASLRNKWQSELGLRFGEKFEIYTASGFRSWIRQDQRSEGRTRLQGIVSIQTLRTQSLYRMLDDNPLQLDLLIVDEAHHCRNRETHQHRAVRLLTVSSDAALFLTATPLHLQNADLFNLLNLLLPEEFDRLGVFEERLRVNESIVRAETELRGTVADRHLRAATSLRRASEAPDLFGFSQNRLYQETLAGLEAANPSDFKKLVELQDDLSRLNLISHVFTRTKKREAYPDAAIRDPVVLQVDFTEPEQAVYDKVYEFCCEHYAATLGNWAAHFPLITLQRQMASSIPAMLEHYDVLLRDRNRDVTPEMDSEDEDDGDSNGEEAKDEDADENGHEQSQTSSSRLVDIPGFLPLIEECKAIHSKAVDSKFNKLLEVLKSKDKVVLFSYFRGTLRYLERRLGASGIPCVRIDGSVPYNPENPDEDERLKRIGQFRDPDSGIRMLLSSEVGSEGLDFQFCHILVNWDLPWNPMVVEQRIGRLDRLGQKAERIAIINFSVPGTIEDRILTRLYHRVGLFEGAIGPLEPILGQQIQELAAELLRPNLTPAEQERLIEHRAIALERRLLEEQRLEAAAGTLMGQDQIFTERMERVRRLGRYVTPGELQIFVGDFLAAEFPVCQLRTGNDGVRGRDAGEGCYWIRVTPELKTFVRNHAARLDDPSLLRFIERADGGDGTVTFDPDVAFERPTVEHLHNQHPLVKAIAVFYQQHTDRIPPVSRVELETDTVPAGVYAFTVAEVKEEGLQAGRSIWVEGQEVSGDLPLDPDVAEQLLHEMVTRGVHWTDFVPPPGDLALTVLNGLEEKISERVIGRRAQANRQNEARVAARLASLRASYEAKRRIREQQLQTQKDRDNQRAIPLFEAQLRRLEAEFEERSRRLEQDRSVTVSYEVSGFGLVHISAPQIRENA